MRMTSPALVDTHCHLDLYPDPARLIRETDERGVLTVAVTNTPSVFERLATMTAGVSHIRVALGLHPELAHGRSRELPLFRELLPQTRFVGEVGLDYVTTDKGWREQQRAALATMVHWCADAGDKIVTVHSRRAADDVIDIFGEFPGTYILHWFSGSARSLARALLNGAYASVNPAMVLSESGIDLVSQIPRERCLTETDGPFVRVGGQPARPWDVSVVLSALARVWGCSAKQAQAIVYGNFARVLRSGAPVSSNRDVRPGA